MGDFLSHILFLLFVCLRPAVSFCDFRMAVVAVVEGEAEIMSGGVEISFP